MSHWMEFFYPKFLSICWYNTCIKQHTKIITSQMIHTIIPIITTVKSLNLWTWTIITMPYNNTHCYLLIWQILVHYRQHCNNAGNAATIQEALTQSGQTPGYDTRNLLFDSRPLWWGAKIYPKMSRQGAIPFWGKQFKRELMWSAWSRISIGIKQQRRRSRQQTCQNPTEDLTRSYPNQRRKHIMNKL